MYDTEIMQPDWIARRRALIEQLVPGPLPADLLDRVLHGADDYELTASLLAGEPAPGVLLREAA
jgi:hypothetical protein